VSTVRRTFFYVLALVTLGILSAGLINLLSLSFDAILARFTLAQVGDLRQQLSLGIAMVVIGGPLWLLFWSNIQRNAERDADESGSALRAFYLNLVLIVSAFVTVFTLYILLAWLLTGLRADQFNPGSTATLIVSAAVWYYHRFISEKEGYHTAVARTVRRWYVYILSATGLIWLSIGLVQIVNQAFFSLPIWQGDIVRAGFWNSGTRGSLAGILTGGLTWTFYWFYAARDDINSSLRQVYFYLLTILGSAIAGLIALIVTLYRTFYWFLGGDRDVANYFQYLGWSIPTILVAFFIWSYHLRIAGEESALERHQVSARRVHYYLMSVLGLGTLIAGLIILLGIPLDSIINSLMQQTVVEEQGWWYNHLSLSLAMLAVSIPIWLYYWSRIIDMTEKDGADERPARSRRIYLYGIIGASVVMLAADLVNIVYQLLNGVLTGDLGIDALRNMKWSLQTVFIAIPILIYHLGIARIDQKSGSENLAARKNITVLLGDRKSPVIALIEGKLGYKVRVSQYAGELPADVPQLSEEDVERLVSQIQAASAGNVTLLLLERNIMVLPYK
jgi:hypothetical protein